VLLAAIDGWWQEEAEIGRRPGRNSLFCPAKEKGWGRKKKGFGE
jgi:hypothetical protein